MKILPPEPKVDLYNQGFGETDLLERKRTGQALSNLVDRIDDPLVIALDGNWGTGKSHFLKRWVGAHSLENGSSATTVYFDAFENDYLNDPLPALVSALTDRLPEGNEGKIKKVKAAAYKLVKPLARIGLAVATSGATEALNSMGDAAVEAASQEGVASLEKYWKEETGRRNAMIELKNAIEALAALSDEQDTGSSLVFVIDELDRCRPDYALEVLEVIKHFFSVPHVHFILGVNLRALENSVRARYGEKVDGNAYLKKFIQVTLKLPEKIGKIHNERDVSLVYLEGLIQEMGIPAHIATPLVEHVKLVSSSTEVSLRSIGKIISSIALASEDVLSPENIHKGWVYVMVDLIVAKNLRPDLYPKFLNGTVDDKDLASYFGATASNLLRYIDNEHNPEYRHEIYWRYVMWLYVVQNKAIDSVDDGFIGHVRGLFGHHGFGNVDATLPLRIHNKWLEQFSFFNPN